MTAETVTRRAHLAAAIRVEDGEWTSARAAAIAAAAGFGPNRNTARLDLGALARRGLLTPALHPGNRTYTRTDLI